MTTMAKQKPGYGPPAPVAVFQWQEEFDQLLDLYRARQPQHVLEIGTYHGGTLYHWLRNALKGATIVSVDSYKAGPDNRTLYPDWTPAGVRLVTIQGDSHDTKTITKVKAHAPYDWVWIDAGHRYNEVRKDWEAYGHMVSEGGLVCFHDILPASRQHPDIEVSRLWQELKDAGYTTQEIIGTSIEWGGIGIVFP